MTTPKSSSALVTAIVGNPKPRSRTYDVALTCARYVGDALGGADVQVVDLAELGSRLLQWGDEEVGKVLAGMRASTVLVVASPTYKATYTGLLKLLFDQVAAGSLRDIVAFPLMVGGAPIHALAVEVHLRPLLVEVGCTCVTPGLFVLESELPTVELTVAEWVDTSRTMIASLSHRPSAG